MANLFQILFLPFFFDKFKDFFSVEAVWNVSWNAAAKQLGWEWLSLQFWEFMLTLGLKCYTFFLFKTNKTHFANNEWICLDESECQGDCRWTACALQTLKMCSLPCCQTATIQHFSGNGSLIKHTDSRNRSHPGPGCLLQDKLSSLYQIWQQKQKKQKAFQLSGKSNSKLSGKIFTWCLQHKYSVWQAAIMASTAR